MTKAVCCLTMLLALAAWPQGWAWAETVQTEEGREEVEEQTEKVDSYLVTEEHVTQYNIRDICELLNLLPGVSASTTGVTVQGSSSKTVAVIMDGRPLFNPASGKVYLSGIPIQSVKEVRLLQGPEAARYVGNTGGGVIVITSKKGEKAYVNKIDVGYGLAEPQSTFDAAGEQPDYYERKKAEFNIGAQKGEVGFFVNALADLNGGDRINDEEDKMALKANMDFPLPAEFQATISGMISNEEKENPGKEYRMTPHSESTTDEWGGSFLLSKGNFGNRVYVNSFSDQTVNPDSGLDSRLDSRVFGEEARWNGDPWGIKRVAVAGNVEYREIDSNTYGEKEETVGGVSLSKEFQPGKNFSILAGLKGNFYSDYDAEANPQLNITWKPSPVRLSLLLERSNTMPTFDQRYYQNSTRLANPDLSLETVYSAKFQFQHDWNKYFSWGLTPFYIKIDDKIEYYRYAGLPAGDPNYGKAEYRNLSSTESTGVNVNATLRPLKSLKLNAEYQYLEAKNKDTDNYLFQKPRHKAKIRLRHEIAGLVSQLEANYNGSRYDDSENLWGLPHRWYLDAKIDYRWKKCNWYLEVDNLFDRQYYVYRGWPGARRSVMAGMSVEF
ncbi:iron complex outermembrane recepter protein [Desulfatibacillum alkenivorans DSM 16219]|uniref:Iron complex outermembrane recepter protein n=1 Tax=Desulfatibacillum alkenivorans DSM 16219 TaxID=1121393 RepID=A0A1M6JX55_9BACT|nr:TonB-dependent receptor plug domain-containing protein [Desulfatibacillum alkenivorans]SHJ51266.1 iron complex outermembrane recepter protein [Desulfatibacillum alkenivorans DSM 16219]